MTSSTQYSSVSKTIGTKIKQPYITLHHLGLTYNHITLLRQLWTTHRHRSSHHHVPTHLRTVLTLIIRREKIHQYIQQWRIDHAENPYIYNKDLNENVKINQLFLLESVAHSAYRYQSTKAVLGMEEVIAEAKFVCRVKAKDNSNQKPFKEMMILRHHSSLLGTVKMTVGIRKRTIEKVQYSITVPVPEIPFVDESSIIPLTQHLFDDNKNSKAQKK